MFGVWGSTWGDMLKNNRPERLTMETINAWTVSLVQAEMTRAEFDVALPLSISAKRQWPPSTPRDFLALARGINNSQLPDVYTAYIQASNSFYLHPVCYQAAVRVGLRNIREGKERFVYPLFREAYERSCNEHLSGASFSQPVLSHQIENKVKPTPASDAISSNYINRISLLLAGEQK